MRSVVFNFHDVILIMTAIQCCFFAILLVLTNAKRTGSDYYFAAFLLVLAFIPIHELILWGYVFKIKVRANAPSLYFITGFSYFIDTVLLTFYVKSLAYKDFRIHRRELIHFIPLVCFVTYMVVFFYSRPYEERMEIINNESFAYSWTYISMDLMAKILRVINCMYCFIVILRYTNILQSTRSSIEKMGIVWLKILIFGFLVVTCIELTLSCAKFIGVLTTPNVVLFEILGLSGYYTLFIVVNILVFGGIRLVPGFESVWEKESKNSKNSKGSLNDEQIINEEESGKIHQSMLQERYYLIPDITLDILAENLGFKPKYLSLTINRFYKKNFYEFINGYRIDAAKNMLEDKSNKKTIIEIYLAAGFNSKSVFNSFFKKTLGVTPSQYRQSVLLENHD